MERLDYSEMVRLLIAGEPHRDLTLADAVKHVMGFEDPRYRMMVKILRDTGPTLDRPDIEAIYDRPDFPRSG